jgi:uncharacterized protein
MAQIGVVIAHSQSLKDKRMVLRRMKDRVRDKLGVALTEVGEQDHRQRAELGVAVTSGDRGKALELIDTVVRVIASSGGGDVVAVAKDAWTFDAPAVPVDAATLVDGDRTGAGDKAAAGDDWVPDAWREEPGS